MLDQFEKFHRKLIRDRAAAADGIAFAASDDRTISYGNPELARVAEGVLSRLNVVSVCAARPSLPFAELLIARAEGSGRSFVPSDTETRTFLHDIPFLRRSDLGSDPAAAIAPLLFHRKGVIVEGLGIVSTGAVTVEQAYINYSSVFHAAFVKYLRDLLDSGFVVPGEEERFAAFRTGWLHPLSGEGLDFLPGPLSAEAVVAEVSAVGRYTVERGLVDSFFGNISARVGDTIYISQTAASLDELDGCIDPVPWGGGSTAGITASSELPAHRAIYESCGVSTILHGHPKFAVILSMLCHEEGCDVQDCWRDCRRVRRIEGTPVVAGEIGAGGIARRVPPVIGETGAAIVYGHGVFATGREGFEEPFMRMIEVENRCRQAYFDLLDERFPRRG